MKLLLKQLRVAAMIAADSFKDHKKTFHERFLEELEHDIPIVVRDVDDSFKLFLKNWIGYTGEAIKIFYSTDSQSFNTQEPYAIVEPNTPTITLKGLNNQERHYFLIENEKGEQIKVAERLIPFRGTLNFRDLGGYPTTDGRRTKWGKIYRSDHLRKFRKAEYPYFDTLNIKTICDFRGHSVAKRFPNNLPKNNNIKTHRLPIVSEGLEMRELRTKILRNELEDFDAKKILLHAYSEFIHHAVPRFKVVFNELKAGNYPILLHCTAGKDRTGFVSAIILSLLGVPKEIVFKDYLASNYFRKAETEKYLERGRIITKDVEKLLPLMEIQADYLQSAFDTIEREYGTVEEYIKQEMEFTAEEVEALREALLE